jgi:hypothetical protein
MGKFKKIKLVAKLTKKKVPTLPATPALLPLNNAAKSKAVEEYAALPYASPEKKVILKEIGVTQSTMSKWLTSKKKGRRVKSSSGRYPAIDIAAKKNLSDLLSKMTVLQKKPAGNEEAFVLVQQAQQETRQRINSINHQKSKVRGKINAKPLSSRTRNAVLKEI